MLLTWPCALKNLGFTLGTILGKRGSVGDFPWDMLHGKKKVMLPMRVSWSEKEALMGFKAWLRLYESNCLCGYESFEIWFIWDNFNKGEDQIL
jgi:hypothetical protein